MAQREQRLTRIEDIEAIKQLKARYYALGDEDHNPDKITMLFVEDGIWEGGIGTAQGHEAMRQLFQRAQQRLSFSHHMVMNPIIEVEGNRAKGTLNHDSLSLRKDAVTKIVRCPHALRRLGERSLSPASGSQGVLGLNA